MSRIMRKRTDLERASVQGGIQHGNQYQKRFLYVSMKSGVIYKRLQLLGDSGWELEGAKLLSKGPRDISNARLQC